MSAYWMRWLDFSRLAGLFAIVASAPGVLTSSELDKVAIAQGVFVASGKPLGNSSRYHHRRALEQLGFVRKGRGRFFPSLAGDDCEMMASTDTRNGLSQEQRLLFSERVLSNADCYEVFWSAFVPGDRPHSIPEFIQAAKPIRLQLEENVEKPPHSKRKYPASVLLYGAGNPNLPIRHVGYNAVQAIHFGMRRWGIEQLRFLDELYQVGQGHHIFPIGLNWRYEPISMDRALYEELRFEGDWAMPRVSDLLLSAASRLKVPISLFRDRLQTWLKDFSGDVAPVFVSERMILFGRSERIHQLVLSGFLSPPDGGLVSHLKVHRGIVDKLESRFAREDTHGSV